MTAGPRQVVEQLEMTASLPAGAEERFSGYGVMGLPFESGHVLAMRRFFTSSVGPGYTSVWHRDPDGNWTFYSSVPPRQGCARYFGAAALRSIQTEITLEWLGPSRLRIAIPAYEFEWEVAVQATVATRLMNAAGRLLPGAAWRSPAVLAAMGMVASRLLGVGRVGLSGRVPNGQRFITNPRMLWQIVESRARLGQDDFGSPGPVYPQAHLGDFWIPQRGMLAAGQAYFDSFDPAQHSEELSCPLPPG